jgi:hypothetical protein
VFLPFTSLAVFQNAFPSLLCLYTTDCHATKRKSITWPCQRPVGVSSLPSIIFNGFQPSRREHSLLRARRRRAKGVLERTSHPFNDSKDASSICSYSSSTLEILGQYMAY